MARLFSAGVIVATIGLLVVLSAGPALPASQGPIPCSQPLTLEDLLELIDGGVAETRVGQFVETCGIQFALTPEVQRLLRERRVSDGFMSLLAPPSNPIAGTTWVSPVARSEMVWIAGGAFLMGSPPGERGREPDELLHPQTVNGFWLDTTEVTYEAFRRFVLANPEWQKERVDRALHDGNYLHDWNGASYPSSRTDWPVVYVSWFAARAYAQWTGRRLPTEAEWEYACRAKSTGPYWWGDAFFRGRVTPDPRPAGSLADRARQNPWRLFDMLGNVWEWTSSEYRQYPYAADDGREAPNATGPRVQRGGAWANGELIVRSANRKWERPHWTGDLVGFRCAL